MVSISSSTRPIAPLENSNGQLQSALRIGGKGAGKESAILGDAVQLKLSSKESAGLSDLTSYKAPKGAGARSLIPEPRSPEKIDPSISSSPGTPQTGNRPSADIDGNQVIDSNDFFAFNEAFANQDASADLDGDGRVGESDYITFNKLFESANSAPAQPDTSNGSGRDRPAPSADIDGNGVVDSNDYFAFTEALGNNGAAADIDGDGKVGSQDYKTFLSLFENRQE